MDQVRMSNRNNKQNNSYGKGIGGHQSQPSSKPQFFALGAKVFINVTDIPTNAQLHCQARVVRVPKHKGDFKYKLVVTGVRLGAAEPDSIASRLIGMRLVRFAENMQPREWAWNAPGSYWISVSETEAEAMTKRTIANIKKDIFLKQKNSIRFLG